MIHVLLSEIKAELLDLEKDISEVTDLEKAEQLKIRLAYLWSVFKGLVNIEC